MDRAAPPPRPGRDGGARTRVADLRRGDRIDAGVFLVEASNFKQTRNQKYFIQMVLRDASGAIKAIRWEATSELYGSFRADDFIRITGRVEEFQGNPQIIVDQLERVAPESVDFSDFLPVSRRSVEEMEEELRRAIAEVRRPVLREFLRSIVEDPRIRPGLLQCPAGKTLHHAWVGGLLEHIVSLMGLARNVCAHYPRLDRDLLYTAALVHDLGKVQELSWTRNFGYTDRGQLVGHIGLGLVLIAEKAKEIDAFPEELLIRIQHIVASHHGLPEYGALKLPMTVEATVFHYLDNLDAKITSLATMEEELPADCEAGGDGGRWSDYKPHLGRKYYFPARGEED